MTCPTLKQLKDMSDDDLIEFYDAKAQNTEVGISFYLDELRNRETARLNKKIVVMTRWITVLTIIITLATIVNVIVFLNDSPTIPGFIE